ncbi:hypothetical protein NUSPORA_00863 [Nucleospora cyclopteri]
MTKNNFIGQHDNNAFSDDDDFLKKYAQEKFNNQMKQIVREFHNEDELIELCKNSNSKLFIHFYSDNFTKCRNLNILLPKVATRLREVDFIKIHVKNCPKIVEILKIGVLPFMGLFANGMFVEGLVGFEKLGNRSSVTSDEIEKVIREKLIDFSD